MLSDQKWNKMGCPSGLLEWLLTFVLNTRLYTFVGCSSFDPHYAIQEARTSETPTFRKLELRESWKSGIPEIRKSEIPEIRHSGNLDFRKAEASNKCHRHASYQVCKIMYFREWRQGGGMEARNRRGEAFL